MDPTHGDPTAAQVRSRLRDGCASVRADQERAIAGLEACLDLLPSLCERIQTRRHTLSRLVSEGTAAGLKLPMPVHVGSRPALAAKVRATITALDRLLRV
ncbi:MAG: hypothetical protein MUP14_01910 [Dehalococcoidia bacterium]|nr:hypothetical protein [Dehalococcoidia bacterium]